MNLVHAWRALGGIMRRELLRNLRQTGRLGAAIVRPLVWLAIFAAGFRAVLGLSIIPPYETYILYEVYLVPGLVGLMLLFHSMQEALAMVYDREMGSMRTLLVSPLPRWYLLGARLLASAVVVLPLVYLFLALARVWEVRPPTLGYVAVLPAVLMAGLMLGAFGLFVSALVRQLENFAGVMNFVIFPMFFASSAPYPLWRIREASEPLYLVCLANPFTHAVELVRHALYGSFEPVSFAVVTGTMLTFFILSVLAYDPGHGIMGRRGGPAGEAQ